MTDIPAQYSNQNQVAQPPAMGLIAQGAVFWKPDYLTASSWLEHLPMLFWLVEAIQPKNTVSLHAGSGVQHFAICQAVDRLRIDANCYAFDSAFQESVYERNENYVAFSQCIEMGPLDAAGQFSQETVDLLLLDGTSSELEQDAEAWLPLLSSNAVMVILGTARRGEGQYGRRLFETLSRKYPSLAFSHGGGVGVVVVGSSPRLLIARLLEIADNGGGIQVAREVFARLGRACHDAWLAADREARFTALQKSLQTQEQSVQVLSKRYESVKEDLARREKETADLSRRIEQQVDRNAHERGTLAQRVTVLQETNEALEVELERLKQQLNEAKQIAEHKAQQILALQAERAQQDLSLEKERFQAQYRAEELVSIKVQLASTNDSLLAEQTRISSLQENLRNERLAHESAQGELKLDNARLTQTLAIELKQREALEESLKAQQDTIATLTSEKQALQKTLNQEKQQTKALTEQAQINAQEHANQVKSLEEFHADRLAQIESQHAQNEQTLLTRLQDKEQSLNDLEIKHQSAIQALQNELQSRDHAHRELLARMDTAQALVADLELKLQAQSTELETRAQVHAKQLTELEQAHASQLNEIEVTHKQALEALQGELAGKEAAYTGLAGRLEVSQALVADLEAKLQAQAAELESRSEVHAKQLEELDQLQTWQISELETVHRNALEALKEELASSHQEVLDNLTRQISDKDLSLQDLETRLASEKVRTSELAYKERELQGTLDAITRQLETKSEEIVVLTHMLEEANATHTSELEQARSEMGTQLKELQTQLQVQADARARQVKEIEAAHQQALAQLNKSLADRSASARELESQLRAEKDNVVTLTSKSRELQIQFDALSKKLNAKSSEITDLQDKLKSQTDIAAKQAKLVKDLEQTHTKQIKTLEASHQRALDELNKSLADKAALIQSIQAELDAEKASRSELSQAVIGLQKNLDLVQQRLETKSSEIIILTQMNEEAEAVHTSEVLRLRSDIAERQSALINLRTSERKLAAALEEKNRELAGLTRILDDLVNEKSKGKAVTRAALSTSSSVGTGWFSGGKRKREEQRLVALIEESDQFQADWYLKTYPDVANHEVFSSSPARHYLKFGGFEGRNPGPNFDSERYLQDHPELRIAKVNPLVHFLSSQ